MTSPIATSARTGPGDPQIRPRVFVSYAREDSAFAEALVAELIEHGFDAYLDTKAIGPGEPWQERLGALIARADSIAFVLSPDSIDPQSVCDWELNEAERLSKRIIPVVCRHVPDSEVPGRLRRLNYVFLTPDRQRANEIAKLIEGLKYDIRWIRQHTDIGEDAERWGDPATGGEHVLLRGKAIDDAELWISSRPAEAPEPTETQRAFIRASREAEIARARNERRQIQRTRWFQRAVGVLLLVGIAGVIWQSRETQKRQLSISLSLMSDRLSPEKNFTEGALRYAIEALPAQGSSPFDLSWDSPAVQPVRLRASGGAIMSRLHRVMKDGKPIPAGTIAISPDETKAATVHSYGDGQVWDLITGRRLCRMQSPSSTVQFIKDGSQFLVATTQGPIEVRETSSCQLVSTLKGHRALITNLKISEDGRYAATASWDNDARIWDVAGQRAGAVLKGHFDTPWDIVFSPDGKRVATAAFDQTARLWDVATGVELLKLNHGGQVWTVRFSRDGTRVVTASSDGSARVWDAGTGTELLRLQHGSAVKSAEFIEDDASILTSDERFVRMWSTADGAEVRRFVGHRRAVVRAVQPRTDLEIISWDLNETIRVWDAKTGRARLLFPAGDKIGDVKVAEKSKLVLVGTSEGTTVWAYGDTPTLKSLNPQIGPLVAADFSVDGREVMAIGSKGQVAVMTPPNGNATRSWNVPEGRVIGGFYEPLSQKILTATADGIVYALDLATGQPTKVPSSGPSPSKPATLRAFARMAGGKLAALGYADGRLTFLNVKTGELLGPVEIGAGIRSIHVHGQGEKLLVSSNSTQLTMIDVSSSGDLKFSNLLDGQSAWLNGASMSKEGGFVSAGADDGSVFIANLNESQPPKRLYGHSDSVLQTAFSPDTRLLASASADGTVRLWSVATGQELARLDGHGGPVRSVAFSPDGGSVVTASTDGRVQLWDVSLLGATSDQSLRDIICTHKLRGAQEFTDAELADPILSNIDPTDTVSRNPCLRRGPLQWEYYTRTMTRWLEWFKDGYAARQSPRSPIEEQGSPLGSGR